MFRSPVSSFNVYSRSGKEIFFFYWIGDFAAPLNQILSFKKPKI